MTHYAGRSAWHCMRALNAPMQAAQGNEIAGTLLFLLRACVPQLEAVRAPQRLELDQGASTEAALREHSHCSVMRWPRAPRRSELDEGMSAEALVFDAATRMFWRNLRARAGPAPTRPLGADPVAYDLPAAAPLNAVAARLPEVRANRSTLLGTDRLLDRVHTCPNPSRAGLGWDTRQM